MFRIIAVILFVIAFGISFYFRRKAEMRSDGVSIREEKPWVMIPLRVAGLALWGSVILYLINPQWMAWAWLPLPDWVRWISVGTAAMAIPLIYCLFASIGTNITQTVGVREEHQLVTQGIYKWVRHPLYVVSALFFLSFALIAANGFIAAAIIVVFFFLLLRLPQEEERLIERFGDAYREYMAQTGRFLPKMRPSRDSGE
jgi:protein-S-isoprenylcysteine O-methyltransferase Ste14